MTILQNVRASEKQEEIIYVGTEAHIYINEREIEIYMEDGKSIQYEYDKVIVENAKAYNDLVTIARVGYYKLYLNETDFKMTIDYFDTITTEKQLELTEKREIAREFIRANKVKK